MIVLFVHIRLFTYSIFIRNHRIGEADTGKLNALQKKEGHLHCWKHIDISIMPFFDNSPKTMRARSSIQKLLRSPMSKKSILDVDVENKVTPPLVRAVVESPFQNIPRKSRAVEESPFQNLPRTPMLFEAYRSTSSEKTDESMIRTMSVTVCPFDGIKKQSPRQESRKLTIWEKGALFGKFILFDLGRAEHNDKDGTRRLNTLIVSLR